MKKLRPVSSTRMRKVACTVSAAALMLGVSHAASVGFNFQIDYCGAPSYSGFPVTLPAFGIGPSSWQNLTPMKTGYGGPPLCDQLSYTLTNVINTTTSTDGLHPLPNGSLTVVWSASTANFSGFGGYAVPNPAGTGDYDGPPPVPIPSGEWQVYSGFLRDGVEFGPPGGPDNDQPGYSVDIVGLKSVFTNTPFVVQLIGASDSMQQLTNAFVIDASLSVTQSVSYPNLAFPSRNEGGTGGEYYRGHGGGLSTVSGLVNSDHIKIIGNRAEHGPDGGDGFDRASCIAGFIITDKPVVSMSPQPVVAAVHDNVNLRIIAAGVPPLSYQWRKGGVPIGSATDSSYSITDITSSGNYDVVVTNLYGSTISKVSAVAVDQLSIVPDAAGSGNIIVSWQNSAATLLEATVVTGPYTDVLVSGSPATSPYTNSATGLKFYRYIRPAQLPNTIDSNPYNM
jgi:hypothetical protein